MSTKWFYDCEFWENNWTLQLVSIGICSADKSRTLYLENKDFDWRNVMSISGSRIASRRDIETPRWLMDNVYPHLRYVNLQGKPSFTATESFDGSSRSKMTAKEVAGNVSISYMRDAILQFVGGETAKPRFYGWYSAYDHFCLANIFGRMIDLPGNFPMYTRDLKQMADETDRFEKTDYPQKPVNLHNALADAMWNADLYAAMMKQREVNAERSFWQRHTNELMRNNANS